MAKKLIVGIDEVGRGPLAGPVSVGIIVVEKSYDISYDFYPYRIRDSKQLVQSAREEVCVRLQEQAARGNVQCGVYSTSATVIDRVGIERAILAAIGRGLSILVPSPSHVELILDGRLKAPREYRQQSLIHGDALVPAIALASIVAKVTRDRYMTEVAHKKFPLYGFDEHKGYGTRAHYAAIEVHGITPIHRRSFLEGSVIQSPHD